MPFFVQRPHPPSSVYDFIVDQAQAEARAEAHAQAQAKAQAHAHAQAKAAHIRARAEAHQARYGASYPHRPRPTAGNAAAEASTSRPVSTASAKAARVDDEVDEYDRARGEDQAAPPAYSGASTFGGANHHEPEANEKAKGKEPEKSEPKRPENEKEAGHCGGRRFRGCGPQQRGPCGPCGPRRQHPRGPPAVHPYLAAGIPQIQGFLESLANGLNEENTSTDFTPPVDLFTLPTAYHLNVSLPGARREDVAVNYNPNTAEVIISGVVHRLPSQGEQQQPSPAEDTLSHLHPRLRERTANGWFERKIALPHEGEDVDLDQDLAAKLEDGVLRVTVPRLAKRQNRRVEVTSSSSSPAATAPATAAAAAEPTTTTALPATTPATTRDVDMTLDRPARDADADPAQQLTREQQAQLLEDKFSRHERAASEAETETETMDEDTPAPEAEAEPAKARSDHGADEDNEDDFVNVDEELSD